MFGFKPKVPVAPVDDLARDWIEISMARLVTMFSEDTLRKVRVFLPTPKDFPDQWQNPDECAELLLCRVCGYMNVDRSTLELEVFHDDEDERRYALRHLNETRSGAAGVYVPGDKSRKTTIIIKVSRTTPADSIISTFAHELCHVMLLGGSKVERDESDMELLTDLATIFFGFGIFTANSAIRFAQYSNGGGYGWSTRRQGYMPQEMIGYSLALFADRRQESRPTWTKYLNVDVLTYFKKSAHFLTYHQIKDK